MQIIKTLSLIFFLTVLRYTSFSQNNHDGNKLNVNQERIEQRIFQLAKLERATGLHLPGDMLKGDPGLLTK